MGCITTYSGEAFDPAQPDSQKIHIADIAHALSLLCRANGHFKRFYSVGQHCVNCALEAQARGYRKRARAPRASALMNRLFASYPKVIDHMRHPEKVYNAIFDELDSLNDSGDLLAIYPSQSIAIRATERDPEVLNAIYALGHADAKSEMKNILYFLSKTRTDRI